MSLMRKSHEVDCPHADECFDCPDGVFPGKGAWRDDLSSAMGGRPYQECRCMTDAERLELAIERQRRAAAALSKGSEG